MNRRQLLALGFLPVCSSSINQMDGPVKPIYGSALFSGKVHYRDLPERRIGDNLISVNDN
jgi:hypothetical protein